MSTDWISWSALYYYRVFYEKAQDRWLTAKEVMNITGLVGQDYLRGILEDWKKTNPPSVKEKQVGRIRVYSPNGPFNPKEIMINKYIPTFRELGVFGSEKYRRLVLK